MRRAFHVTPHLVSAVYELLRMTCPYKGWRLPHADDIVFEVLPALDYRGVCVGHTKMRITEDHSTLTGLIMTVAHEMCHIKQDMIDPHSEPHGDLFLKLMGEVCRVHQYDKAHF